MHTNVERIASLFNITTEDAIYYYRQVSEQLDNSVTTDMVSRGVNLYLNRYPNERKPSPCDIADFFYAIGDAYREMVEQDEMDNLDPTWMAQEKKKEWEELPWPEEERHIMYIATNGYAFGEEPWNDSWEDSWEVEQHSKELSLVDDWFGRQTDKRYEESASQNDENDRRVQVQGVCKRHTVSSLFHFTRRDNLASILQRGILSRRTLEGSSIENVILNDQDRLDNYSDASCLSISFPNYKMFYKYRSQTQSEWLVLELHASILWKLDCAFCHTNAASADVRKIPLEQRKNVTALKKLFIDYPTDPLRAEIPSNYTTDPQAEVLVFDPIPTRYLKAVHFRDKADLQPWGKGDSRLFWCRFISNKTYFEPRMDYKQWQSIESVLR